MVHHQCFLYDLDPNECVRYKRQHDLQIFIFWMSIIFQKNNVFLDRFAIFYQEKLCITLVPTFKGTAGHVHDINEGNALLHEQERMVFADAGYRGIEKRPDVMPQVRWYMAISPGKRKALDKSNAADALLDAAEILKAGVRDKVEHLRQVIKRQFGFVKVRCRGLKKNTQQLRTLFALSNLWMVRSKLMGAGA